jgi:hypothetical protein
MSAHSPRWQFETHTLRRTYRVNTLYRHGKGKNFTLRIDARLLDEFLAVCRKKDEIASAVLRKSMRRHIRQWRKDVSGKGFGNDADDDLVPGYDQSVNLAMLHGDAAAAKRKRLEAEKRMADHKADAPRRLSELRQTSD